MQECAPGGCLRRTLGLHKEECWRRLLGCAPGGDFGEVIGMCTRRGAWEGPWVCIKRDVWEGWWECAPRQVFGQDVGMCTKMGGLGCVELQQDHVYRDLSCPWLVWGGEECLICTTGFKWSLLNPYWRLIAGSICFNFSHGVGVAEEGFQQQREVLGWFASHPLLLFY